MSQLFSKEFLSCPWGFLAGTYDASLRLTDRLDYAKKARYYPENTRLINIYLDSYIAGFLSNHETKED